MPAPKNPTAVVVVAERHRRGWSQTDLANEMAESTDPGWSRSRVRRLEAGELSVTTDVIQALSRVLDVDYGTLIDGYARRSGAGGYETPRYVSDEVLDEADEPLTSDYADLLPVAA